MSYKTKFIDKSFYGHSPCEWRGVVAEVCSVGVELSNYYPEFNDWYGKKVIPGLLSGDRTLIVEYRKGVLAGFAIVKDDGIEKKLSCLRVLPEFENSGMGIRLFERSFDVLETSMPLLSVAEENLYKFRKIFDYFGFLLVDKYSGIYRANAMEYSFNGELTSAYSNSSTENLSANFLNLNMR